MRGKRLRVHLRVEGATHAESAAGSDVGDQFVRETESVRMRGELRLAFGRIAPQRHHRGDPGALELVQDAVDLPPGVAHAGEVRHGGDPEIPLDLLAQFQGLGAGGASGTVGHGNEIQGQTSRALQGGAQVGPALLGLRWKELEGESRSLGGRKRHGHSHIIIS